MKIEMKVMKMKIYIEVDDACDLHGRGECLGPTSLGCLVLMFIILVAFRNGYM